MEKLFKLSNNLIEYSKRSPILKKEEEYELISKWVDHRDQVALQKILNSYLRLAVSYARKYSNYGLPIDDLIHEGVLGIIPVALHIKCYNKLMEKDELVLKDYNEDQ